MVFDQIYNHTRTVSKTIKDNGGVVVVNPQHEALIITDIDITIKRTGILSAPEAENVFEGEDFQLILQIGDDERNFVLADMDVSNQSEYHYKSQGLAKYWNGGRLELLKNFEGTVTIAVQYLKLYGQEYSLWIQR